jgi:hypothetical protein
MRRSRRRDARADRSSGSIRFVRAASGGSVGSLILNEDIDPPTRVATIIEDPGSYRSRDERIW